MDPQACDDISHPETDEAIETNPIESAVLTTILPNRATSTTLHPSQAGPTKTNTQVRFNAKVYKTDEACRCCDKYFDYLEGKGVGLEVIETKDMQSIYEKYNIPHEMQSCHTILLDDYFIEGHVPMEAIEKLLSESPEIDGITLPGKPYGAPGMRGAKTGKFTIYALSGGEATEFLIW
jgi:hypothetical protein